MESTARYILFIQKNRSFLIYSALAGACTKIINRKLWNDKAVKIVKRREIHMENVDLQSIPSGQIHGMGRITLEAAEK